MLAVCCHSLLSHALLAIICLLKITAPWLLQPHSVLGCATPCKHATLNRGLSTQNYLTTRRGNWHQPSDSGHLSHSCPSPSLFTGNRSVVYDTSHHLRSRFLNMTGGT